MNAKLKSWYCPDIEDPLNYFPPHLDNFYFLFRALVGPAETEGEESFDIQVCTPKWLLSNMKENEIVCVRHFIIIIEYNFIIILDKIKRLIESCSGNDWNEIAEKLSRIGFWEFEDYKNS